MQINVTFDQAISSLPAGFVAAVNYVVGLYDKLLTNAVTVNIDVGYGEVGGQTLASNALGESDSYLVSPTYAQAASALRADASSTLQKNADATLPATAPYSSGNLWLSTANAKALGLISPTSTSLDGYVGFSSTLPFSYSTTGSPGPGQYNFVGVAEHEISEVLGRISLLGDNVNGATSYGLMDLFRYSGPGVRDLTATPPSPYSGAYFSVNNGTTDLNNWNTSSGGDLGDWASTAGADAFLAFSPAGQANGLGSADDALLNALGWNLTPPSTTVTSIIASPSSQVLSIGQTVTLTVTLNAAVSVTGATAPELLLNDGGFAVYNAAATAALKKPSTLVFSYTVSATDHNESALAVVGFSQNGASVTDEFGNVPNFSGSYVSFSGLSLSQPTATVTSVATSPGSGTEGVGQTIKLMATFSSAVAVSGGTPTLTLNDGGTAIYDATATAAVNNPAELVFDYTVSASDLSVAMLATTAVNLNGATIVSKTGAATNLSGLLTSFKGLRVATSPPVLALTGITPLNASTATVTGTIDAPDVGLTITLFDSGSSVTPVSGGWQTTVAANANGTWSVAGVPWTVIDGSLGITATNPAGTGLFDYVFGAAAANGTALIAGSIQYVFGNASGVAVDNGATQDVYVGGSAGGATLYTGGVQTDWGTAINATLNGGTQYVFGSATGTTVVTGAQDVESGGRATGAIIDAGGAQTVYQGGTASGTALSGGTQFVYGGTVDQTTVGSGGLQYVFAGVTNTTIAGGGQQNVYAGGLASATEVNTGGVQIDWGTAAIATLKGGTQYVFGSATGTTVVAGTQDVESFGSATGAIIDAGGVQTVYEDGTANGTTLSGGNQYVYGGTVDQTVIESGGLQYVFAGVTNTTIASGGEQNVYVNGSASATTVNTGGVQIDWGTAGVTTVDGGIQYVFSKATGTTVGSGVQDVEAGGIATGAIINAGGAQNVYQGGTASGTTLSGGNQFIYGGTVDQTTIGSGGLQYLYDTATNTTIDSGGEQNIYAGGSATGCTIESGGSQVDWGSANTTTIAGGTQYVIAAAAGTTINAGTQFIESGGLANQTTINGGTEHVYTGGTANGVSFIGASSALVLDQATGLIGLISGFGAGDTIDLGNIAFSHQGMTMGFAENANNTGGTLTVSDGSVAATLALLGQYTAANFSLSSDGYGGTLISDPGTTPASVLAPSIHG